MSKPEWGIKRICQSCGAKFYDMRKDPIACPSCGTNFNPDITLRARRPRSAPAVKAPKKAKPVASEELETEVEVDDDLDSKVADGDDDNLLVADDEPDDGDDAIPGVAAGEGDKDS